ncbi:DNA helicase [Sarracenia purpurea var. burkii]
MHFPYDYALSNLPLSKFTEGGPSIENEDSQCKIITSRTVFDHIREKAKSFPTFAALSNVCSPSSKALLLLRKRAHEKKLEPNNAIEILDETERNITLLSFPISCSEDKEQQRHDFDKASSPNPPMRVNNIYPVVDIDKLLPDSEESTPNTLTGESIFEHIRKKAKNFPMVNRLKSLDSESFIVTKEHFTKNQLESKSAAFDVFKPKFSNQILMDTGIVSDSEHMEMRTNILESPRNSIGSSSRARPYPPSVSKSTSEIREVESFLGFKSVFSFL